MHAFGFGFRNICCPCSKSVAKIHRLALARHIYSAQKFPLGLFMCTQHRVRRFCALFFSRWKTLRRAAEFNDLASLKFEFFASAPVSSLQLDVVQLCSNWSQTMHNIYGMMSLNLSNFKIREHEARRKLVFNHKRICNCLLFSCGL